MNKRWTFITLALIVIFAALALFMMVPRVTLEKEQSVTISFPENEEVRTLEISDQAANRLYRIVGGQVLRTDKNSCSFSESLSFSIGERAFYLPEDGSAVLQDAKTGRCVNISEEDRKWIDALFQQYREQGR